MITKINKVVRIGISKTYGSRRISVYCHIQFNDGKLSITGVEGPIYNNCMGGAGQINMAWPTIVRYIPPWNANMCKTFLSIWKRWHLNDMRAGTPLQEEFARKWYDEHPTYSNDSYTQLCDAMKEAGIYEVIRDDGTPYKYGHGWLKEEVPNDVLEFLASLPSTDQKPSWV